MNDIRQAILDAADDVDDAVDEEDTLDEGLDLGAADDSSEHIDDTPPIGGHLRGPPRVDLGPGHAESAKLTLGRASEMTPDGRYTVFSAGMDSLGGQECTSFSPEIPQNGQNGPKSPPKGGTPPLHVLYLVPLYIFFPGASRSPKMGGFKLQYGNGVKKHHFGAPAGTIKKNISRGA